MEDIKIRKEKKDGKLFFVVKDIYDIYANNLLFGHLYPFSEYKKDIENKIGYPGLTTIFDNKVVYESESHTTVYNSHLLAVEAYYVSQAVEIAYRNILYKNDHGLTSKILDYVFDESIKYLNYRNSMSLERILKLNQKKAEDKHEEDNPYDPRYNETNLRAGYKGSISITDLAHLITGMGFDISGTKLCQWMRDKGYLLSNETKKYKRNVPAPLCIDNGWMIAKHYYVYVDNKVIDGVSPVVTERGQYYFIYIFKKLKKDGEKFAITKNCR